MLCERPAAFSKRHEPPSACTTCCEPDKNDRLAHTKRTPNFPLRHNVTKRGKGERLQRVRVPRRGGTFVRSCE